MKQLAASTLALPAIAAAQPPYTQPPAPDAVEPKLRLEVGVVVGSPRGDLDELAAETSPGVNLLLGFTLVSYVSVFGGLRYLRVLADEEVVRSDTKISHRELQLGLRFALPVAPAARVFVDGDVHATKLAVDGAITESQSGVGVGVRAGLIFTVAPKVGIGFAVGYSKAHFSKYTPEFDDNWLTGDVGLNLFY